jgi:methylated-DNA-[protein]-cysteine S-methyltransferase
MTVQNKRVLSSEAIYRVLRRVPAGKVTTYGDIARFLGRPGASRAVGRILNSNPDPVIVPCHRVIMSDGRIGGYAFGKQRKKELLEKEGVSFDGEIAIGFEKCRVDVSRTF